MTLPATQMPSLSDGFDQAQLRAMAQLLKTDAANDALHADVLATAEKVAGFDGHTTDDDIAAICRIIASPPSKNWNNDLSPRFMALRQRNDDPAILLLQVVSALRTRAGIDNSHPMIKPLLMGVILGGVPSDLPFHSHHHTREVVCLAGILGLMQNQLTPFDDAATAMAELLIAACIHDYAHDGQGNRRHDRHTPMRLEHRALEKSERYLKSAGLTDASWQRIRVMVLATDVSKDGAEAISPAEWLRRAYAQQKDTTGCPPDLLPLFTDTSLMRQTGLLEDADLGTSAGMPYDHARRMTALIADETKVLSPTPQTLIGFIDHICRGTYITTAAQQLFGDNMKTLRRMAEQENANTIYYWS